MSGEGVGRVKRVCVCVWEEELGGNKLPHRAEEEMERWKSGRGGVLAR
jgi:hypothetical protein